jgi:hypothetical protein
MAKLKMTGKEVLNMVKDYYRYKYISGQSREVKVMKLTDFIQGERFLRSVKNPDIIWCGVLIHVPNIIDDTCEEIIMEHYIVQYMAFDETKREIVGELWVETVKKEDLDLY